MVIATDLDMAELHPLPEQARAAAQAQRLSHPGSISAEERAFAFSWGMRVLERLLVPWKGKS